MSDNSTASTPIRTTGDVIVQFADVQKWFGSFQVLRDINLTVNRGERIVICGPSGSGKSVTEIVGAIREKLRPAARPQVQQMSQTETATVVAAE